MKIETGTRTFQMMSFMLAGAVACGSAFLATAEELPDGKTLIHQYFEACGGKAALEGLKNQRQKGKMMLTDMGLQAKYLAYTEPPNHYNESDFQGIAVKMGDSNGIAWSVNPFSGNTAQKNDGSRSIDAVLRSLDAYEKFECVGEETIGEAACYKVEMTHATRPALTVYFDQKSGYLIQIVGSNGVKRTFGDYKPVGNVTVPHKMAVTGDEVNFEITYESVEFNVDIPEGQFDLPPEIQAIQNDKGER
jgi:hypothetical protein